MAKQDLVAHGFKLASSIPPVTPTLALFQGKDLGKAQSQYRLLEDLKVVLPILALVLIVAGVYAARGRRNALVGAGLGLAASMLVLGIGLEIFRSVYLSSVPSNVLPSDAAAAVWDALVHFIKQGRGWSSGAVTPLGAIAPEYSQVEAEVGTHPGRRRVRRQRTARARA